MKEIPQGGIKVIEKREWQLWVLTLTLLIAFGGFAVVTFFIFSSDGDGVSPAFNFISYKEITGFVILIGLFCGYAVQARVSIGRTRRLLEKQAMRDTLTGLLNRQYLDERIEDEINRAERAHHLVAILLCDLDRFKNINDTLGHQVGDEVLKKVAKSIRDATRGVDLVFRWGGDEILVVLSETTRQGVLIVADRIRKGIGRINHTAPLDLDISIGVSLFPEHGRDVDELIRLADRALYIAKKGGDKIHIGEEEYRLDEKTVNVVFQAVVDVRTNTVLGHEALSRDPEGKLSIQDFFKRYEAVGQLKDLKSLCFKIQLKKASELNLERVFINVDFGVLGQFQPYPKPQNMEVILEISEAEALYDIENHLKITKLWRAHGYKFAIDDFGAGFISLPFISQLIPDYIKMDRSTIVQAVSSKQFLKFLRDLVLALRNYSKEGIIAEGVETEEELQAVKDLGIDPVQGYLLGFPKELDGPKK
ncbi:MAG TPA: diguanylate cyclase [Nitrospiria bacterium]